MNFYSAAQSSTQGTRMLMSHVANPVIEVAFGGLFKAFSRFALAEILHLYILQWDFRYLGDLLMLTTGTLGNIFGNQDEKSFPTTMFDKRYML